MAAYYEVYAGKLVIRWTNPEDGAYTLALRTADSLEWNIYYGGHSSGSAPVALSEFNLTGTEMLVGRFEKHTLDGSFVAQYPGFFIDLSSIEFPEDLAKEDTPEGSETGSSESPTATPTATSPVATIAGQHAIEDSAIGAYYTFIPGGIEIRWEDPEDGAYILSLRTADSYEWNIYYGGHSSESAPVVFSKFNLSGTENLKGAFTKHAPDGAELEEYRVFIIALSSIEFPEDSAPVETSDRTVTESSDVTTPTSTPTPSTTTADIVDSVTQHPIEDSGIGAYYIVRHGRIDILWDNPEDATYTLSLRTKGSPDWNIYSGGHDSERAAVALRKLSLSGTETLVGNFEKHTLEGSPLGEYPSFEIDLSAIEFPSESVASGICIGIMQPSDIATTTPAPNISTLPPPPADPARHDLIDLLTGDFTDTDGDGMTDAAEAKYGFDPNDPSSFPTEPPIIYAERHPIGCPEMGAYYTVHLNRIEVQWTNPNDIEYSLNLRTSDSDEWDLYQGGHYVEKAPVDLDVFELAGTETLVGEFNKYDLSNELVGDYSEFILPLTTVEFPDRSTIGNPSNRLSYTFSSDFPKDPEVRYREFLKRVFPIIYEQVGPPAESFNVNIEYGGDDVDAYVTLDDGRTIVADQSFIPRLMVHELVHAWNGNYAITSDENWYYNDSLSGFEESIAEGTAYEIIHEYVRSYPDHFASFQLLDDRPLQYWSDKTTSYDAIKHARWTGAGDFWTHSDGPGNRYSIAATTVQMLVQEEPTFVRDFMALYYETIRQDPQWRPNRDDVIGMWEAIAPTLNGYPLKTYLNAIPVFNGRKLDEGIYVLQEIRSYGEFGDQQFAVSYAIPDGRLWWSVREDELGDIPGWISINRGDDDLFYVDTQNSNFTVSVVDAFGSQVEEHNYKTNWKRWTDSTADGFGWYWANELEMHNFPLGLYKETVTFTDYIEFDQGASEDFYFIGVKGLRQDRERDYVIMIGVDGVQEGTAEITIDDVEYIAQIKNGLAIFKSRKWPIDLQGKLPITITNKKSESRNYFRTLIEAGTVHDYFQHQFIIVDTDFNGVEDQFE